MNEKVVANKQISRQDKLIAMALAILTIVILLFTVGSIGLTWDEPHYIVAAETYPAWFGELFTQPRQALSQETIAQYWEFQHEHPPFGKVWAGIVWLGSRYLYNDLTAYRFGNILLSGLLVALLYLFLTREYGRTAGLVSAAALITMPRFFFHAQMIALDVPVTLMIFAVTYVFWLGRNRTDLRWTLMLGLVWGLGLATKINALFIPPIVLFAWTILFQPRRYLFIRLALMAAIGSIFFFVSWPWLYHDSVSRLLNYLGFLTLDRYPTEQFYFGELYAAPHAPVPWHFPFVMTALVVPFSLLLLAIIGVFYTMRHRNNRQLGSLLLLGASVSLLVLTTSHGQPFDNERLLMPVFPFVAALAGIGFVKLIPLIQHLLQSRHIALGKPQIISILAVVAFGPHLLLAYDLYPYLLSYYSEAIGGAYGAKVLQLETTYWCNSYPEVMDYLNEHATPGAVVWGTCHNVLAYYQLQGKFRADLQIANGPDAVTIFPEIELSPADFNEADYVIIQYRQGGFFRALREWMHPREPVHEVMYRRLRLAEVYEQDRFRQ
jgi:4-amino-4-deoxy-L-arabinose transferase-like glycosyltransferase